MQNLPQKVRSKKLSIKVDLTAMVSVSFLLIIFFMVVGELSKPKVLEYAMTDCNDCGEPVRSCFNDDRNYTILLGENNKLVIYAGFLQNPLIAPQELKYGKDGIRKELLIQNKKMLEYSAQLGKPGRGINVIIKPTKKSNYGNLVDILDEMKITGIKSYNIVSEFSAEETKLLAAK